MLKETLRINPEKIPLSQESNSEEHKPIKDFNNTREFWNDVIVKGIGLKTPQRISGEKWTRNIQITRLYITDMERNLTLEQIASLYGMTRENVRQIIQSTTLSVWNNSDSDTQNCHPKEGFSFKKPASLETSIRRSIGHGGISATIRKGLLAGLSIEQIKQQHNFTTKQIKTSRRILRTIGVEVPHFNAQLPVADAETTARKIREAEGFETVQSLLNKVSKGFLYKNSRGDGPLLVSLRAVVVEAGIRVKRLERTTEILKREPKQPVAVGKTPRNILNPYSYYFIRFQDKALAIEILKRQISQTINLASSKHYASPQAKGL